MIKPKNGMPKCIFSKRLQYSLFGVFSLLMSPALKASTETLGGDCNPVGYTTCALPFPSDLYTVEDSASPTGRRVSVNDDLIGLLKNEDPNSPLDIPHSIRPAAIYEQTSGFSAATPVFFELPRPVLNPTPVDSGEAVLVYEIGDDSLTEVPVRSRVLYRQIKAKGRFVEVWPQTRYEWGKTYVVAVTKKVKPLTGEDFEPTDQMARILNDAPENDADDALIAAYEPALDTLDQALSVKGLTRDELISVTYFTIRDKSEIATGLAEFHQKTAAKDYQIRNLQITHEPFSSVAVIVRGDVNLTQFRNEDGGLIDDVNYPGEEHWVEFLLTIPRGAKFESSAVMVYGHGVGGEKESLEGRGSGKRNGAQNIATIGIDMPNHGVRSERDGGHLYDITKPKHMARVSGMTNQSAIDLNAFTSAIKEEIQKLNTLPRNPHIDVFPWLAAHGTDSIPDMDADRMYYNGVSMGTVLAGGFVGTNQDIKGAYLHVPGAGITNVVFHSTLWKKFKDLVPKHTLSGDLVAYLAMFQHTLDFGDGINFIDNATKGTNELPYPFEPRPVAIGYGIGDAIVPMHTMFALVGVADIPITQPDISVPLLNDHFFNGLPAGLTRLPEGEMFDENGNGALGLPPLLHMVDQLYNPVFQFLTDLVTDSNMEGIGAHLVVVDPVNRERERVWRETVIVNSTVGKE